MSSYVDDELRSLLSRCNKTDLQVKQLAKQVETLTSTVETLIASVAGLTSVVEQTTGGRASESERRNE